MEEVNQELLAQRETTQHVEDRFHENKCSEDPPKPEKERDVDNEHTTKSNNKAQDDDDLHFKDRKRQRWSKSVEREASRNSALDDQRKRIVEPGPPTWTSMTAENMVVLVMQGMAGELGVIQRRVGRTDKGKLFYIPDLGSKELPLSYTKAMILSKHQGQLRMARMLRRPTDAKCSPKDLKAQPSTSFAVIL